MGLGKYGGVMETIEHPSLQWGKSFQAATKISAGEITLQSCCASWLTLTRVRMVMWHQVIPLKSPNPISLSHDTCKQIYSHVEAGGLKWAKQSLLFTFQIHTLVSILSNCKLFSCDTGFLLSRITICMYRFRHVTVLKSNNLTILELCLFTFLLRVRWEHQYHSHLCSFNYMLETGASLASYKDKEQGEITSLALSKVK